ncbi:hypothetical protein ACFTAO_06150 [Paenibacillus rhizoplanae]
MRIFSLGIDQLTNNEIKLAGFTVIAQSVLPEPEHAGGHLLMVTSEQVPVAELRELRGRYPDSSIFVHLFAKKGVRGYQAIHMQCESLGIFFSCLRAAPQRQSSISYAICSKMSIRRAVMW